MILKNFEEYFKNKDGVEVKVTFDDIGKYYIIHFPDFKVHISDYYEVLTYLTDKGFDTAFKRVERKDIKPSKCGFGVILLPDKEQAYISQLDMFNFFFNKQFNSIEITSVYSDITFSVNADTLTEFIQANKEVIFDDF